jgi:hypothetical protein
MSIAIDMDSEVEQMIDVVVRNNTRLAVTLNEKFMFPRSDGEPVWRTEIEFAQEIYELAKANEMAAMSAAAVVKFTATPTWEAAMTRAVASSEAGKKRIAESDDAWRAYEHTQLRADNAKRDAEKWHSAAFQRLETLRMAYNKLF